MFPEGRLLEWLIIGALALIVVGPKDLPVLMRKLGQFLAKMRGMAAEFRASFDELARQSELDELRREVEALRSGAGGALAPANPLSDSGMKEAVADIHQNLDITFPPRITAQEAAEEAAQVEPEPEAPPPAAEPSPPKRRSRAKATKGKDA